MKATRGFFGGKYRRNLIATFAVLFFFIYTIFWRNRHFSFEETAVVTGSLVQNIIWVRKSEIYTKRVFVPVKKENQLFSCGEFLWLCTDGSFWCVREYGLHISVMSEDRFQRKFCDK